MNKTFKSDNKKTMRNRKLLIVITPLVGVVLAVGYLNRETLTPRSDKVNRLIDSSISSTETSALQSQTKNTIGNKWQRAEIEDNDKIRNEPQTLELPFTEESMYQALKAVKISDNGGIILDHITLISLDEALERIYKKLDTKSIDTLKNLIMEALPEKPGRETAKLVEDYYHFLLDKHEFSKTYEPLVDYEGSPTVDGITNQQNLYDELRNLRETHLGYDTSKNLFQVSDAEANFMFENMKIDANKDLDASQRKKLREEARETFIEESIAVENWPNRYRSYTREKQNILDSKIENNDKESQIIQLYNQTFSAQEQQEISHLRLHQL